jgi:hypothetical protein
MSGLWIVLPPWIFAVAISFIGQWGRFRFSGSLKASGGGTEGHSWLSDWSTILITNLVFLSLMPISLLSVIGVLLPFNGARAGLSMGLLAFVFGSVPARLFDAAETGWDRALWMILIDLLRIGGAMAIVGYLVV